MVRDFEIETIQNSNYTVASYMVVHVIVVTWARVICGPRALGIHIRQITSAYVTTNNIM